MYVCMWDRFENSYKKEDNSSEMDALMEVTLILLKASILTAKVSLLRMILLIFLYKIQTHIHTYIHTYKYARIHGYIYYIHSFIFSCQAFMMLQNETEAPEAQALFPVNLMAPIIHMQTHINIYTHKNINIYSSNSKWRNCTRRRLFWIRSP